MGSYLDPEAEAIVARLDGQRRHVIDQLDGLTDEQLRRPVLPSGWSGLGLVRHLTLSDERYWFEVVVAGGPLDFWPDGANGDWAVGPDDTADEVLEAYRNAIRRSNEIVAARRLDDPVGRREEGWAEDDFPDVRAVLCHVLVETAVHAGQLDAVRELIDGRQYIVL